VKTTALTPPRWRSCPARHRIWRTQVDPKGSRRDQSTRAERAAIERRQLDVVEYEEVAAAPAASARQALERLSARYERLLVHFDVDVIDFTDAPLSENTGCNVGLTRDQAFETLAVFLASHRLAALTVTELNPDHGEPDAVTMHDFVARLSAAFGLPA
jgi:arginase